MEDVMMISLKDLENRVGGLEEKVRFLNGLKRDFIRRSKVVEEEMNFVYDKYKEIKAQAGREQQVRKIVQKTEKLKAENFEKMQRILSMFGEIGSLQVKWQQISQSVQTSRFLIQKPGSSQFTLEKSLSGASNIMEFNSYPQAIEFTAPSISALPTPDISQILDSNVKMSNDIEQINEQLKQLKQGIDDVSQDLVQTHLTVQRQHQEMIVESDSQYNAQYKKLEFLVQAKGIFYEIDKRLRNFQSKIEQRYEEIDEILLSKADRKDLEQQLQEQSSAADQKIYYYQNAIKDHREMMQKVSNFRLSQTEFELRLQGLERQQDANQVAQRELGYVIVSYTQQKAEELEEYLRHLQEQGHVYPQEEQVEELQDDPSNIIHPPYTPDPEKISVHQKALKASNSQRRASLALPTSDIRDYFPDHAESIIVDSLVRKANNQRYHDMRPLGNLRNTNSSFTNSFASNPRQSYNSSLNQSTENYYPSRRSPELPGGSRPIYQIVI